MSARTVSGAPTMTSPRAAARHAADAALRAADAADADNATAKVPA